MKNAPLLEKDQSRIARMFNRIAPCYDFLNHFLSAGFDRWWRLKATEALSMCLEKAGKSRATVLDVATGTGDLAFAFLRRFSGGSVIGVDIADEMLLRSLRKARSNRRGHKYSCVRGDALALPFRSVSFDALMIAYGIRNVPDVNRALEEFYRVIKPGGYMMILEFGLPEKTLIREVYLFYFNRILPFMGGLISGDREAYTYLPVSVHHFLPPCAMEDVVQDHGFEVVHRHIFLAGISYFIIGRKVE
ncbi:bifunctional demethylmenaquinone methyltransferase/2-methoxy-6-polyprenyl-1,4-benzoquinol methylase UbiE [Thermodesulforhabdus norvegica]|uniref:Demethylmenaquinone methyltransferase n=1 Tax=Thermodesulforhabdus norvegica TaxID=39841 RepID=A0A1I4RHG0_9BACT|nr:bifunctional demethylmenaquinone methyltransferase/2-methoxy-6-polyprenyl-1,4-benzoquinol methylase UbiE [Thermodesulforhabdus norvegica]SFM51657.1 demethylmenaquinone methyltransferase / 2-methoxy-6-polyprenyl-1,4-benzoquinol methylase [Thermodesulforhabdus norvegica]